MAERTYKNNSIEVFTLLSLEHRSLLAIGKIVWRVAMPCWSNCSQKCKCFCPTTAMPKDGSLVGEAAAILACMYVKSDLEIDQIESAVIFKIVIPYTSEASE